MRRIVGFAVLTMLIGAAQVVSAAQAAPQFTAGEYPALLRGEKSGVEDHVFAVTEMRKVICNEVVFGGELAEASPAVLFTPSYSCHAVYSGIPLPIAATVAPNGCGYLMTPVAKTGEGRYSGDMDLLCPEKSMEIRIYLELTESPKYEELVCAYTIPQQEGMEAIELRNSSEEVADVELDLDLSEISYTKVFGVASFCAGSSGTLEYTGSMTVTAENQETLPTWFEVSGD